MQMLSFCGAVERGRPTSNEVDMLSIYSYHVPIIQSTSLPFGLQWTRVAIRIVIRI